MLGEIVDRLEDPMVAAGILRAIDEPELLARLALAAGDRPPAEVLAATVRRFLETASDDQWLQLVGIMGRAADPALAALRAILMQALPQALAASHG